LCAVHGIENCYFRLDRKNVELPYSLHFHPSSSEIGSKVVNKRNTIIALRSVSKRNAVQLLNVQLRLRTVRSLFVHIEL
jgi:hypothetical protein